MRGVRFPVAGHLGIRQWSSRSQSPRGLPLPSLPAPGLSLGKARSEGGVPLLVSGSSEEEDCEHWGCLEAETGRAGLLGFQGHAGGSGDTHFLPRYLTSSHQLLLGVPTASSCFSAAPRGGSGTSAISRIKATASRQGMTWAQEGPGSSGPHTLAQDPGDPASDEPCGPVSGRLCAQGVGQGAPLSAEGYTESLTFPHP